MLLLCAITLPSTKATGRFTNTSGIVRCKTDLECGAHGSCALPHYGSPISVCVCESPYINLIEGNIKYPCAYQGVSRLNTMFGSLLGGFFGVDWFMLAQGNPSYIVVGCAKMCMFLGVFFFFPRSSLIVFLFLFYFFAQQNTTFSHLFLHVSFCSSLSSMQSRLVAMDFGGYMIF